MLTRLPRTPASSRPMSDLRLNKPELRIEVNRERPPTWASAVEWWPGAGGNHAGQPAGHAKRDAEQVRRDRADPGIRAATRRRTSTASMCAAATTMIPLSALVKTRESVSPRELNHFGQRRSVPSRPTWRPTIRWARRWCSWTRRRQGAQDGLHRPNGTSREN